MRAERIIKIFVILGVGYVGTALGAGRKDVMVVNNLSQDIVVKTDVDTYEIKQGVQLSVSVASNVSPTDLAIIQVQNKQGTVLAQRVETMTKMPSRVVVREIKTVVIE